MKHLFTSYTATSQRTLVDQNLQPHSETSVRPPVRSSLPLVILSFLLCTALAAPQALSDTHETPTVKNLNQEFNKIAEEVSDAVVHINTLVEAQGQRRSPSGRRMPEEQLRRFFGDEFFKRFFDRDSQREDRQFERGPGSGVIVDSENGYVVTNHHVIKDANKIKVNVQGLGEYEAELVGSDSATDLAILQIDTDEDLPEAEFGDVGDIKVGHHVLVIGNPFGLDQTVTSGIISAKGRAGMGITEYENFIQTDAAVNPGNSGGPLVNMDGEIIGISTAILSRSGGYMGIGFAIPVDMVKSVMTDLIEHGEVTRGWLGVRIQELTPALADALEISSDEGVLVADVISDTPADEANIHRGDLITEVNGQKVTDVPELRKEVAAIDPGSEAAFTIIRDGETKTVEVEIGQRPDEHPTAEDKGGDSWDIGIEVQNISPEQQRRFNIKEAEGVLITSVDRGTPAARAGLRPGAVIVEVNRKPVTNVEEYHKALQQAPTDRKLLLLVNYQGATQYVVIEPQAQ